MLRQSHDRYDNLLNFGKNIVNDLSTEVALILSNYNWPNIY